MDLEGHALEMAAIRDRFSGSGEAIR